MQAMMSFTKIHGTGECIEKMVLNKIPFVCLMDVLDVVTIKNDINIFPFTKYSHAYVSDSSIR